MTENMTFEMEVIA